MDVLYCIEEFGKISKYGDTPLRHQKLIRNISWKSMKKLKKVKDVINKRNKKKNSRKTVIQNEVKKSH